MVWRTSCTSSVDSLGLDNAFFSKILWVSSQITIEFVSWSEANWFSLFYRIDDSSCFNSIYFEDIRFFF